MKDFISFTFGGLSKAYYFRQLFFGALFLAFVVWMSVQSGNPNKISMIVFSIISTFLYPYSRFVYERIVGFFMGDNVFFVNAFIMLWLKLMTMMMCWFFAVFIAPIGLAYLYFHHRKEAANNYSAEQ